MKKISKYALLLGTSEYTTPIRNSLNILQINIVQSSDNPISIAVSLLSSSEPQNYVLLCPSQFD